jgi:cytoplasmic iron level regulating protein YaaA (DUF328/UPF0246 family)
MSLPDSMREKPRYLLILTCSQRKRIDTAPLPAIDRYTGVNFQVLHKAKREGYLPENLDILILSAKYGLIEASTPIENYDLKMTKQRAMELQSQVSRDLDNHLSKTNYEEIFVNLGKFYLIATTPSKKITELESKIVYATGGIGQKMSQMKDWLSQHKKI